MKSFVIIMVVACVTLLALCQATNRPVEFGEARLVRYGDVFAETELAALQPKPAALLLSAEVMRSRQGLWPELPIVKDVLGGRAMTLAQTLANSGEPGDWRTLDDATMLAAALLDWMETDPEAPGPVLLDSLPLLLESAARLAVDLASGAVAIDAEQDATLIFAAVQLARLAKYGVNKTTSFAADDLMQIAIAKYDASSEAAVLPDYARYRKSNLLSQLREFSAGMHDDVMNAALRQVGSTEADNCAAPILPGNKAVDWFMDVECTIRSVVVEPTSGQALRSSQVAAPVSGGSLPLSRGQIHSGNLLIETHDDGMGGVEISRRMPVNSLQMSAAGHADKALRIVLSPDSPAEYRASLFHEGLVYLIAYDNPSLTNFLLRAKREGDKYVYIGEPVALPSLEDPAGGTYEMIPKLWLLAAEEGDLHIVGGSLNAVIGQDGQIVEARVDNCSRVVEAIATPQGVVTLCIQREERGPMLPSPFPVPKGCPFQRLRPRPFPIVSASKAARCASQRRPLPPISRPCYASTSSGSMPGPWNTASTTSRAGSRGRSFITSTVFSIY